MPPKREHSLIKMLGKFAFGSDIACAHLYCFHVLNWDFVMLIISKRIERNKNKEKLLSCAQLSFVFLLSKIVIEN